MRYKDIEKNTFVIVTNDALETKGDIVTYREVETGHSHSLCREWFTEWFMPAPRWAAEVRASDCGEAYCYDLTDNGEPAGTMSGFRTKGSATFAASKMVERMNSANFYK